MALDLTVNGLPIFASRSRVNTDSRDFGTFTASSLQALLKRIVDGDPFSFWNGSTADDSTTESIEVSFQDRGLKVARPINLIGLQNFNGKLFSVSQKVGAGTFSVIPELDFSVVPYAGPSDLLLEIAPITPDTLRLNINTTQIVDDFKKVGGFYAMQSTLQLTSGNLQKYDKRFREEKREVKLGDGAKSIEYIRRSAASYEHYGSSIEIRFATQAERDTLRSIKRQGTAFSFLPEPGDLTGEIFTVQFKGAWRDKYLSANKLAGYIIGFNLDELGPL